MKIFLTGGTGFIGSHFIEKVHLHGHSVVALRRNETSRPRISLSKQPEWIEATYRSVDSVQLQDIDILVHLATHSANHPYDTLINCMRENSVEPFYLFESALAAGVRKYIVAGSYYEYGLTCNRYDFIPAWAPLEPTHPYPASKAAASIAFKQWALVNNCTLSIQRIFQVYGPGELETRLWPSLCKAAKSGEDFPISQGTQIRDFIHVTDVATKIYEECCRLERLESNRPEIRIANVGSGVAQTIFEFCERNWNPLNPSARLIRGAFPCKKYEVMRAVPDLEPIVFYTSQAT